MTKHIRISDVMNLAGLKNANNKPFNDGDIWLTCPGCELGQTAGQATFTLSDRPTRITEYSCGTCNSRLAAVIHWGVEAKPDHSVYRLGAYAIDTPVDLYLSVAGTDAKVKIPSS
ncbi:hypothetical protein [Paenarthrobacter ureafaciens]|uniref:hypothetical protein n=1 Tax=Paenarthrobacter ureafaciens TaxID=37931 RepID=UPI001408734F|nr:hypothetical protein [Paenarthrobacter ureafaciens]MCX8454668.1 hypothetical protein [Paenarthrobacter ureafaciens]MCY0974161.1 hypothetical protein [Paenarthrobacter ureafaciens]